MAYKWIELSQNFDRSLPFTKVRFDLSASAAWLNETIDGTDYGSNCFFAEAPNVDTDGMYWRDVTGASYSYAGDNRFTLRADFQRLTVRSAGLSDAYISSVGTLVSGSVYEYTYPTPVYFSGIGKASYPYKAGYTGVYVYVDVGIDITPDHADFTFTGGTTTASTESETSWTATTTDNWFSFVPTTGESGTTSITITVPKNDFDARTGKIIFADAEDNTVEFNITQGGTSGLVPSKKLYKGDRRLN